MAFSVSSSAKFVNSIGGGSGGGTYTSRESIQWNNQWIPQATPPPPPPQPIPIQPVTPTFDPRIEANALYGKKMVLSALGFARIGSAPAPIVGPYFNAGTVDFIVSFGVPADPAGTRLIYAIWFDNLLAWQSVAGGSHPGDGTFTAETFDFVFRTGRLNQDVLSLEEDHYPLAERNAYRPQMLLQIRGLPYARIMTITGKPVPYVACDIGDVTGGADPDDGITIGEGYERIAYSPFCGMTSAKLEEVGSTDVTGGYLLRDNFNIIQIGQSLTNVYRNLVLSTSDKIRLTDRGSNVTPDIIFDRDTIIGEVGVTITRTAPSSEPREDELLTVDPDQDYTIVPSLSKRPRNPVVVSASIGKQSSTLPVILNASTRQALITYAQYHSENARKKVAFQTTIFGIETEPGDFFALALETDGLDNEVFKVTEVTVNGDWTVEIQGEAVLRCSIYGDDSDPFIAFVMVLIGPNPGTDGSKSFFDEGPLHKTLVGGGVIDAEVDTAQFKFGGRSVLCTRGGVGDFSGGSVGVVGTTDDDFELLASFTFEGWFRFSSIAGDQGLFGAWNPPGSGYLLRFTSGSLDWFCVGGTNFSGSWSPVINIWYHVAIDRDGTTTRLYVDGVKIASVTGPQDGIHGSDFGVGQQDNINGRPFAGWFNEFRFTNGIARYATDTSFPVPTAAFPRV